ncbi:uncharacterized protein LOC133173456 [Saccostrea echinata]|uniref:uncharacterized protein LOC133173456 n=1 Tax=Saccostrea echinata TaxID=191078 RepID=UPI002A7FFE71|nr:uncharacterized protein LOC133173456 [Saccostrea echinata]
MQRILLLVFSWCLINYVNITWTSPCKTTTKRVTSYQVKECTRWFLAWCTYHAHVWRYRETYTETCCPGYGGSNCQPFCNGNCRGRGACIRPDTCSCRGGYTGNACQTPVCSPKCQHGSCTRPGICKCYGGYTGSRCENPVCNPTCRNGGVCESPNTCRCPSRRYTGPKCNIPVCDPPCLNGGTCSNSRRCQCPSTYTGSTCQTPVCRSPCQNGGTCVSPDVCVCRSTHTGYSCETPVCSHQSPCFPGTCDNYVNCQCHKGFTGQDGNQRCKTMTSEMGPIITQCTSILAFIERTGQRREMYRFVTDSSEPNSTKVDTMWVNQNDYNYINITFAAIFTAPDNLVVPKYVKKFKMGIISGRITIFLHKVGRNDGNKPFVSRNDTIDCKSKPGPHSPNDDVFYCNYTDENFDRQLENGDNLTLTVFTENGGYRELIGSSGIKKDLFIGQMSTKSTMFRFDFVKPNHCLLDRTCEIKAFDVSEDITKSPLELSWQNWEDELSGIQEYKIQIYLLKLNTTKLAEPNPWHPDEEISLSASETSYTYTPKRAGVYSFILNVIDRANNTQYARTLVLYDPSSNITLSELPFQARSAEAETNFQWQNNLTNDINMSWKGHFRNKFQDDNKLLNPVTHYKHFDYVAKYEKLVPNQLDDNSGKRTLRGIRNVHGIVKFEYFYRHGNQGDKTPRTWYIVNDTFSETQKFNIERKDGDTINFWVRATDIMGNTKVDLTKIFFDSSPPKSLIPTDVIFTKNVKNATFAFSSRLQVDAFDGQSGIHKIHVELRSNSSNKIFHESDIPGNKTDVDPGFKTGYTTSVGSFFYYRHDVDINNCWMVVSKEKFAEEFVLLNLIVYNMAMEPTSYTQIITDVASLNGMDEYSGPINLTITATYDNGVRLNWIVPPTCYERSKVIVQFRSSSGQVHVRFVDKDADWFDLTGLDPETSYNLSFVTEYGPQRSDPVFLHFKTAEAPAALTGGAIAGISLTFLIMLGVIAAMLVLWRLGRLTVVREDIQRRVTVVRKNIANRLTAHNPTYDCDDIYIYGQMDFNKTDNWIVPSADIVLDAMLTSGRFADIYKARYQPQNNMNKQIVVAKTLKSGYSEENMLMMKAKINFFGKEVGEHPNIVHFIGAVVDNEAFGPFMVLEYCEKGQLRDWLLQKKNTWAEDTEEQLHRIVYGISKGMSFLESKKLVHKRLAARNILLTEDLEPKIYGFGPEPPQQEGNEEEKDATSDEKERIPVKWAAPECLISLKSATSKSDVWSFGVVLWEVFSLGETPYPGMRSRDVQTEVRNGHRMKRPEFANDFFYGVMTRCWKTKPKHRPSFKDLSTEIGNTFNAAPSDEFYYYSKQ